MRAWNVVRMTRTEKQPRTRTNTHHACTICVNQNIPKVPTKRPTDWESRNKYEDIKIHTDNHTGAVTSWKKHEDKLHPWSIHQRSCGTFDVPTLLVTAWDTKLLPIILSLKGPPCLKTEAMGILRQKITPCRADNVHWRRNVSKR